MSNQTGTPPRQATGNATRLRDFLTWLGGADKEILAQVPRERARFVQMALVMLTTSGIATVSMIFAMHDGVRVPLPAALIAGVFWGFIILNLDRFLVLSMGATRARGRLLLMALPRLLLAAVISLVIATPLTLRVFQRDINVQIQQSQAAESKLLKGQIAQSGPAQEAGQVQRQITADQRILAGQLPLNVTNPLLQDAQQQISQLQPQVAAAAQKVATAQAAFQCEEDGSGPGCEGASKRSGFGPLAQLKKQEYENAVSAYDALKSQLDSARRSANAAESALRQSQGQTLAQDQRTARAELPALTARYHALQKQVQSDEQNAQHAVSQDDGILAQLSGLAAASASNPVLVIAQLIVTALFFLIEILPVSVKILLNLNQLTMYESVVKLEDDMVLDGKRQSRLSARREAQRAARNREEAGADMQRREQDLAKRANEHVAREMEAILDVALQEWSSQVRASLGRPPGGPGSLPGAGGPGARHSGSGTYDRNGTGNGNRIYSGNGTGNGAARGRHHRVGGQNGAGYGHPYGPASPAPPYGSGFGLTEDEELL
jgi:hypothetical protein